MARSFAIRPRIFACFSVCFFLLYYLYFARFMVAEQKTASGHPKKAGPTRRITNSTSLTFKAGKFYLDEKPLQLLSGAVHYFRVPQAYWRDRLLKLKAAGLNAVETYAPWNLHEEQRGEFSFKGMLDVRKFLTIAQELGLHVIFRPGPYICSEWDFGGLPSWLLADPKMRVRSMHSGYTQAAEVYLAAMLKEVADLQYMNGGPIVAFQLENEFGSYGSDARYLQFVGDAMRRHGAVELFFTCDGTDGIAHATHIPGTFAGVNYNKLSDGDRLVSVVKKWRPDMPVFATELWTGWFLTWGARSASGIGADELERVVRDLLHRGASLNLYMLHGGTNFGFLNGCNGFTGQPMITSYDYGAPLSEQGRPTPKYEAVRRLILSHLPPATVRSLPALPDPIPTHAYGRHSITEVLPWDRLVDLVERRIKSDRIMFMEEVGQNFGFILYRSSFKPANAVTIHGVVADRAVVLVNSAPPDPGNPLAGVVHHPRPSVAPATTQIKVDNRSLNEGNSKLDILVENLGRVNYAAYNSDMLDTQRKGIWRRPGAGEASVQEPGSVVVDGKPLSSFQIASLDFGRSYLDKASSSKDWLPLQRFSSSGAPALHRTVLDIHPDSPPKDTFVDMTGWTKGAVFVNGFNLGRYWNVGPQLRLYLPAPVLRPGANEVLIFELHQPASSVSFEKDPKYKF